MSLLEYDNNTRTYKASIQFKLVSVFDMIHLLERLVTKAVMVIEDTIYIPI